MSHNDCPTTLSPLEQLQADIVVAETCCTTNTQNLLNNQATLDALDFDLRLTEIFVGFVP